MLYAMIWLVFLQILVAVPPLGTGGAALPFPQVVPGVPLLALAALDAGRSPALARLAQEGRVTSTMVFQAEAAGDAEAQAIVAQVIRLIAINLKGPYFLTQAVANDWISKLPNLPSARSKPRVINISSVSAYAVSINRGDYCVSKAGLAMATQLFAVRLAEYGINVYELRPGTIATDMTAGVQEKYDRMIAERFTPIARWGTPEDVGRAVVTIAQNSYPFSTGEVINVDGGFHLRRL